MKSATPLLGLLCLVGCASTTTIRSYPDGADVKLNGAVVGKTPYVVTDTEMFFNHKKLTVERSGFKAVDVDASKNQFLKPRMLLGCLCPLVWLWAPEYPAAYDVDLAKGVVQPSPDGSVPAELAGKHASAK
jgi:hypothetical protein